MAPSHYDTLGVAEGAPAADLRRAYLDLARRLHPDGWIDAGTGERAEADRRMREVNEAWRVLGNPARRLAYDTGRRRDRATARPAPPEGDEFTSGTLFAEPEAPVDAVTRFIRALPWLLVLGALGAIFIFTAYATSDSGPGDERCIRKLGSTAETVDCSTDGARVVVREVVSVSECPVGTEAFQPAASATALCLQQ